MKKYLNLLANLAMFLGIAACTGAATETQRTPNPSRTMDAVIAARKTLATAAPPTEVYVLPRGAMISASMPVFTADGVDGLQVTWDSESRLTIHAEKARVFLSEPSVEVRFADGSPSSLVQIGVNVRGRK